MSTIIYSSKIALIFGATLSVLASDLLAQTNESGPYIGGSYGRSDATFDERDLRENLQDSGFSTTSFSEDESDRGYKVFGGYQFSRYLAIEGGYFDLGSFSFLAETAPPGSLSGGIDVDGYNIDAVGLLPIGDRLSVLGRVGAAYSQSEARFSGTGAVNALTPYSDESDTNVKFGLGAQWSISENIGLRIEAERYHFDDSFDNRADIDLVSIGMVARFSQSSPDSGSSYQSTTRPAPVPVVVPAPRQTDGFCNIVDLQFEIKADSIQAHDEETLQILADYLTQNPNTNAVIEGHSDSVGDSQDNMRLSQRRAENVVRYLVRNHDISRSRLSSVGYGESRPLVTGDSEGARRANRRIGAVIACVTDMDGLAQLPARITMAMQIGFDRNSARIGSEYNAGLRNIGNFMRANPSIVATVEGHTDNASPSRSTDLSQRRAQNVVDHLFRHSNIAQSRMTAVGFGESRRYAYNTSAEGRQANRRVNIILEYPDQSGPSF